MNAIFQAILDCHSLTAIRYRAEAAQPDATAKERETLQYILEADTLDDMHLLAADALGDTERAKAIRDFQALQATRKATRSFPALAA